MGYLTEYDPAWTGPAGSGSERLPMVNPPPAGRHVAMARFRLAESFHQSGNPAAARMELEDLLKIVSAPNLTLASLVAELATDEGRKLPEEIRWLTLQTYFSMRPELLQRGSNIIGQQIQIHQNTGAFIGNTGGLPTTDIQLFVLADGKEIGGADTLRRVVRALPKCSQLQGSDCFTPDQAS